MTKQGRSIRQSPDDAFTRVGVANTGFTGRGGRADLLRAHTLAGRAKRIDGATIPILTRAPIVLNSPTTAGAKATHLTDGTRVTVFTRGAFGKGIEIAIPRLGLTVADATARI